MSPILDHISYIFSLFKQRVTHELPGIARLELSPVSTVKSGFHFNTKKGYKIPTIENDKNALRTNTDEKLNINNYKSSFHSVRTDILKEFIFMYQKKYDSDMSVQEN